MQTWINIRTCGDIQVFHSIFVEFTDFEDFNWPALQAGEVCSQSLYGMNFRGDYALEFSGSRLELT